MSFMAEEQDIFFVEKKETSSAVNGNPVLSEDAFFSLQNRLLLFNTAIRESRIRERIALLAVNSGAKPLSIYSHSSVVYDDVEIGQGAILSENTIVTSNVCIGKFFHLSRYSYVSHDCNIGDYVTFGPGVQCNGRVQIGDHVYVGAGAIIREGSLERPLMIGANSIIGMGAVVTKDVPANTTVIGNPARQLTK
jgi:GDP-perosamine N-acetyltransferase